MKLAARTADFFSYTGSQTESMALLRDAGFRYADYSFGCDYKSRTGIYGEDFSRYLDTVAETADRLGLTLVQAHAPMGAPLNDPDGSFLQATKLCVEACGRWGIPNLVVHSGYLPNLSKEDTFAQNRDFFLSVLEEAEKQNVNILVENFNRMSHDDIYWIDNATDLLHLIELVDHPLFHAVCDTGHANLQPMPQNEEMKILGDHIKAIHFQDNPGDYDVHFLPYQGTMDIDSVICGLQDIGYKGYFTFEVANFFYPVSARRQDCKETRLHNPPFALQMALEKYLYTLGKTILEAYDLFEE